MKYISHFLLVTAGNAAEGSDGEEELPVLKRIEEDLKDTELASPDGKQVDLFSEIHLNELKKLEKQLEQVWTKLVPSIVPFFNSRFFLMDFVFNVPTG